MPPFVKVVLKGSFGSKPSVERSATHPRATYVLARGGFPPEIGHGRRDARVITTQHNDDRCNARQRQKNAGRQRHPEPGHQRGGKQTGCAADIPASLSRDMEAKSARR